MLSICNRCIIYDQPCFKVSHKQVTEHRGNKSQRETDGRDCVASRHLECPLHYRRVYKGLINHIITPHRIISPSLLQTVKAREKISEEKRRDYIPQLSPQTMWYLTREVFHKTLNLGNRLVAFISALRFGHV